MSDTKHTPGPWNATCDGYGEEIWFGGRGHETWTISGPNAHLGGHSDCHAQFEADAQLIAAAPELLEACELVLLLRRDELANTLLTCNSKYPTLLEYLESAITKALGKESPQ